LTPATPLFTSYDVTFNHYYKEQDVNLNKYSFVAGNLFGAVVVGLIIVACGGGGGGGGATDYGIISADNIILNNGTQTSGVKDGIIRVQANQLPSNVKVLAQNVSLVNTQNSLKSNDLQTALDKEISVDVGKTLIGIWDIQNVTGDTTYQGKFATGRVEFKSDGSYKIISGGFGAAGKVAGDPAAIRGIGDCYIPTSQNFTLVGDGAIYFTANAGGNAVATVSKSSSNAIILIGSGGCGPSGESRISKLTRVGVQSASYKSSIKGDKPMLMLTSF